MSASIVEVQGIRFELIDPEEGKTPCENFLLQLAYYRQQILLGKISKDVADRLSNDLQIMHFTSHHPHGLICPFS